MNKPILLLEWLAQPTGEVMQFPNDAGVRFRSVGSRDQLITEIQTWLRNNPNAQFLYIGSHGNACALAAGPAAPREEQLDFRYLAQILRDSVGVAQPIWLWLGACNSASVAAAWNNENSPVPVRVIVGFSERVTEDRVISTMTQLVAGTGLDPIRYLDDELGLLRAISNVVELFYLYDGRYIPTDQFEARTGQSLSAFLNRQGRLMGRLY